MADTLLLLVSTSLYNEYTLMKESPICQKLSSLRQIFLKSVITGHLAVHHYTFDIKKWSSKLLYVLRHFAERNMHTLSVCWSLAWAAESRMWKSCVLFARINGQEKQVNQWQCTQKCCGSRARGKWNRRKTSWLGIMLLYGI